MRELGNHCEEVKTQSTDKKKREACESGHGMIRQSKKDERGDG